MTAAAPPARGVLVTRPGEAGRQLSAALRYGGQDAIWWPAFDLLEPQEPEPLRALTRGLADFDLVIFVSPAAVRGWAQLGVGADWPAGTVLAAVGAATLELAGATLPGADRARTVAPDRVESGAGEAAGSEALWTALQVLDPQPRRVLIVRAEAGREWLAHQLQQAGAEVQYACVYRRVEHRPGADQLAALRSWLEGGVDPVCLLTSSEAIGTLDRQLGDDPDLRRWLRQGLALCTHPRIGAALRAAGYQRVAECEATAAAISAAVAQAARTSIGRPT